MRLLIHGINYAPEFVGIGKYTSEMAEWFAARGHQVRVHTARPYYPQWRVEAPYDSGKLDHEMLNAVDVRRSQIYVPANPSGLNRIRHHLSWLAASRGPLIRSAREFAPDLILSIAPSLIGAPAALAAGRAAGVPTVLHVQDFEVGAAGAAGLIRSKSLLGVASWVERTLMGRFDYITTISDAMLAKLDQFGVPDDRTALVRNWADVEAIQCAPFKEGAFRAELGIAPDQTVLMYAGTLSRKQGLETVLDAARQLRDREDLVFLIYGDGPTKAEFEAAAEDLTNVHFGPFQPKDKFSALLAAADIHLLPQIEGAADLVLPSKLTGMLASGRPVIATTPAESGLAHEVGNCGAVVPPGDPQALSAAIAALADDFDAIERLGRNARDRALAVWRQEAILQELEARLADWSKAAPLSSLQGKGVAA
jgi:colanic acid biosynthesis glycosyl transferase WcaI